MPKDREQKNKLRLENKRRKKELKKIKKEKEKKYREWLNLPVEQWSEARKKYLKESGYEKKENE